MAGRAAGGKLCRNTKLYCDRKARRWARLLGAQALGARGARRRAYVGARAQGAGGRAGRLAWRVRQADAG